MLDTITEGVVWAIMFLPLGSFRGHHACFVPGADAPEAADCGALGTAATSRSRRSRVSFLLSLWALDGAIDADGARIGFDSHEWVTVEPLEVNIGITLDGLTAIMLVVVTGVSLLVQVYSQEYMRGDVGYNRYFAYMSLFTVSMLGLVLASSILQLFVFWELVGLCSYLLIGFWFYKDSARRAATKAFLVTRIGDLGFLIAILIILSETGTLDIREIEEAGDRGRDRLDGADAVRARAVRGRGREVGAVPPACLAAGRDGGPDAGLGPDPRRDDGGGGCLPCRAFLPGVCGVRGGADDSSGYRRDHGDHLRAAGDRGDGHQAGDGLLDDQPARDT